MNNRHIGHRHARHRNIALLLPALLLFSAPALGGDVFKGKAIYQDHCKGCHGQSGAGEVGRAPDFTIGEGLFNSDMSLMETIAKGKGVMPGYRGVLNDEEILDVISYIRVLL